MQDELTSYKERYDKLLSLFCLFCSNIKDLLAKENPYISGASVDVAEDGTSMAISFSGRKLIFSFNDQWTAGGHSGLLVVSINGFSVKELTFMPDGCMDMFIDGDQLDIQQTAAPHLVTHFLSRMVPDGQIISMDPQKPFSRRR